MTQEDYQKRIDNIIDKIGNEASNLILDDVAILLNDNKQINEELKNKDKKIEELNKMNSTLQTVNGNLLQQVSVGIEETEVQKKEQEKPSRTFNMRDVFDEKGNFKI